MLYVLTSAMCHPVDAYQLTRTSWRVPVGNSGNKEVLVSKIITLSFPISWIFYTFVADITYSTQGVPKV